MIKLWLFFLILILIGTFIFVIFYSGYEYECTLPNGGYLIVRWNEKTKRIEVVCWNKAKKKPAVLKKTD